MSEKEYELSANINAEPLIAFENDDMELNDLVKEPKKVEEEKKLLIYEAKSVSIFKIICHLSGKLEIFFMIFGTLCTFFSGCSQSLWCVIAGNTINELTSMAGAKNLPDDQYNERINRIKDPVNKLIIIFAILGGLTFISNFFMLFLWGYSALRQMDTLKIKYFELILNQEQSWFDEHNSFEFATKVQSQLDQVQLGLGDRFSQIILMIAEILSGFTVGFMTSWKLTLIICSAFPIIVASVLVSNHFTEKLILKSKELNEKSGGISEELLYNIKTVTSFCNFDFEMNRYNQIITEISECEQKRALVDSLAFGILYSATLLGISVSIIAVRSMINKEINPSTGKYYHGGDIFTVVMSLITAIYSISGLGPNFNIIKKSCLAASDYFILLSKHKKKPNVTNGYRPSREEFQGKIEFKNVSFSYPYDKTKKLVLDNLNLVIEPGKKIAIVGESGCGKSTTISLIERFYDINSGEILIDGVDIKKYDINYLRDLIGYVQQEPVLFNFSIKDNLIFGRQNKLEKLGEVSPMIVDSCEEAQIKNFIEQNPERYNYIVGIKGSKLSGGQKQRLAIARAILMKPKILILDEATSALDNRAEKKVQNALDNISKKNITTIVIAHRLSTIKNADLIYVMKNGKIIEKGTHRELRDLNGFYTSLIRDQLAADEIRILNERLKNNNMDANASIYISAIVDTFEEENLDETLISVQGSFVEEAGFAKKKIKIERKKLWDLVTDHKCDLTIGILSSLLFGAVCPLVGLVIGKSINFLSLKDKDKIRSEGLKYCLIYIAIAIFGGLTLFLKTWKLQGLGAIISMKIKKKVFEKYLELDMGYFDIEKNSPGALSTKLTIDSSQLDSIILEFVGGIATIISTFLISIILGMFYDWKTTLILVAFMPLIVYGIIKKDDYKENGRESNKAMKIEAGSFLSESVVNIKTIFSFNFQTKALELYENILNSEKKNFLKDAMMQGLWLGIGLSVFNFAFGIAFKCGFIFLEKRTVTFDNLMSSINILMNTCDGLSDVLRNMGNTGKAKLAYQSVFETLDTRIKFSPFKNNNNLKQSAKNIEGNIEFKNVSFSYPTKPDQLILKNLSFSIKAGQRVGLVGLSGSGKSSIIQLIVRFYDVNKGEILIDGKNIQDYNLYELRKKIGLVSQEPSIFKRKVYENILYGDLDAKKEKVLEMAQRAHINYLIKRDNNEKDTPLSGGEKQRVAIARAFLKEPSIILLDEATSAMDIETENEVIKNINENLNRNKTCINVSHRLSSIINSDIIFVLDKGQLVEKGTHDELLKLKGKYYTLYTYSNK
jgi:ATP-binding cassette subfamily B (MDR/TAP) protein 1